MVAVLRAKRRVIREVVQEQLGRLKADAVATDVEDTVLHRLERFGDPGDGPAITFDELNLVLGFFGDAALHFGDEEIRGVRNIDRRAVRVTGPMRKREGLGQRGGRAKPAIAVASATLPRVVDFIVILPDGCCAPCYFVGAPKIGAVYRTINSRLISPQIKDSVKGWRWNASLIYRSLTFAA